jgi:hypothetical protein
MLADNASDIWARLGEKVASFSEKEGYGPCFRF